MNIFLRFVIFSSLIFSFVPTLLAEGMLDKAYDAEHPYYLKYCATTRFHPVKGRRGTFAGHAVFFLKGVCTDKSIGPSGLRLCSEDADYSDPELGVGISIDQGLKNVNFFTFPSRSLFFFADLEEGQTFTPEIKERMVKRVLDENIFEGLEQHSYPKSVQPENQFEHLARSRFGTDYGLSIARNVYCMNVPFPRAVMGDVVDHLNSLNASYEDSQWAKYRGIFWSSRKKDTNYHWNALWDNCTHTPINALAAIGVLDPKKTNRPLFQQLAHMAIPSNTILDIHKAVNQEEIDVDAYYEDPVRREIFLKHRWIPQIDGSSAEFIPMYSNNTVYKEDDRLLFMPSILLNVSKKIRKLAKSERYSYLGNGDRGFAPNLEFFLIKYEKALSKVETVLSKLEKKQQGRPFNKERLEFVRLFKEYLLEKKSAAEMRLKKISEKHEY